MYSIFHFFRALFNEKDQFKKVKKLETFPFDNSMLSCVNKGVFPDLAIRINKNKNKFTGGELIELKDSDSYAVSSFNSTIPSRKKNINDIIVGENSKIRKQMEEAGDKISSLPEREVYYLVRGKKQGKVKVCLVHGSFFETVAIHNLISQSFSQVLDERLTQMGQDLSPEVKEVLLSIFSAQENFSKVRTVDKASVKLRFRIMTEVKAEGNILNSDKYPEIKENTLNLIIPCHSESERKIITEKFSSVFGQRNLAKFNVFKVKHHFNGYYLTFQIDL